jgi:hypothetical protein
MYCVKRASSWGWATWRDRWSAVNWDLLHDPHLQNLNETKSMGTDFPALIKKYRSLMIDSWAVPWCYHAFKDQKVCVYPTLSKVRNIGFDSDATHTSYVENRYNTILDPGKSTDFVFAKIVNEDPYYSDEFLKRFSYYERLKWKLLGKMKGMSVKRAS